ncbi:hypothetical protein GCM10018954_060380 [Kutzneria kofuensis]
MTIFNGMVAGTAACAGPVDTSSADTRAAAASSAAAAVVHNFLVVRMREFPSSDAGWRGGRALGRVVRALSWSSDTRAGVNVGTGPGFVRTKVWTFGTGTGRLWGC